MNLLAPWAIIALCASDRSIYASGSLISGNARKPGCLPLFDERRSAFAPCLEKTCLVFKNEPPIVELGAPPYPPRQLPFRCATRARSYPELHGAFFELLDEIPQLDDAYCICTNESSFDDVVRFLTDAAKAGPFRCRRRIVHNALPYDECIGAVRITLFC